MSFATLAEGQEFDPMIAEMQGALDALAGGQVDAERVQAVKSHMRYAMLMDLETPSDVAELAARFMSMGGDLGSLDAYLEAPAAVTDEELARVARDYLNENRRFVVTLAHGGES